MHYMRYSLCTMRGTCRKDTRKLSKHFSLLANNGKNTPKKNSNSKRQSSIVMALTPTKSSKKSVKNRNTPLNYAATRENPQTYLSILH